MSKNYYDVLVRIYKKDLDAEQLADDLLCAIDKHMFEVSKPEDGESYEFRGYLNERWFRWLTSFQAMHPEGAGYSIYIKRFSFETYRDEWTLFC